MIPFNMDSFGLQRWIMIIQNNSYTINVRRNNYSINASNFNYTPVYPIHYDKIAFNGLGNKLRKGLIKSLEGLKSKIRHKVIVISGPSGVGKDTIISAVQSADPNCRKAISYTTRSMRAGEIEGRNYYFITQEQFDRMNSEGKFFNQLSLNGKSYGGTVEELELKRKGGNVFLNMSAEEAYKVKDIYGNNSVLIFIKPPSLEELERRLVTRGTESLEEIRKRVEYGRQQIECADSFDTSIVNDTLNMAIAETTAYIKERRSVPVKIVDFFLELFKKDKT